MKRKDMTREIVYSSKRIGQLYPILVDYFGNTIDGEHRLAADKNWRKIRLENIRTKKDLLIARIISNACRRNMPYREKSTLLGKLGKIYQNEGLGPGEISHKIAENTGMSYSWVMKYLPAKFKDESQSIRATKSKCDFQHSKGSVATRHIAEKDELITATRMEIITIHRYKNTHFVNITMKKSVYDDFEEIAKKMDITSTVLITNILISKLNELKKLFGKRSTQSHFYRKTILNTTRS